MIGAFTKRANSCGTWFNFKGGACALSIVALLIAVTGCPPVLPPVEPAACEAEGFSCDDGDACNGVETCAPNDEAAGDDGCLAGTAVVCEGEGETCDATTGECSVPEPECAVDADCAAGLVCEGEMCVAPANNDLAGDNADVDFVDLTVGEPVSVTAPDFTTLAQAVNEGCSCSWTTDGAGTFDPNNVEGACTTNYTPAADDTTITVDITCDGEVLQANQTVRASEPTPPAGPSVTLDCPGSMGEEDTISITATTEGFTEGGTMTFAWTSSNGDIDLTGNPVSLTSTNPGASAVTVTVTSVVAGDPDADPVVEDITETATAECTVTKSITELLCDAGPDRTFFEDAAGNPFTFGTNITSNGGNNANSLPTALSGSGSDVAGMTTELRLQWSVGSVPPGMDVSDVVVTSVVATPPSNLTFFIVPNQTNAFSTLQPDATVDTGDNGQVSPGTYSFTLTVTRQDGTASTSCSSNITLANAFTFTPPVSPAGVQSGTTPALGSNTSYVTIENGQVDVPMVLRSLIPGTLNWILEDMDSIVSNITLNSETLAGSEDLINSTVVVTTSSAGRYNLTGSVLAGEASVGAGTDTAVDIYVNRDVFNIFDTSASPLTTPTIDVRPAVVGTDYDLTTGILPRFGGVTSVPTPSTTAAADSQVTFHGLHDAAAGANAYDGLVVRRADLDGDGVDEILILDDNRQTIRVCNPFAADPATAANSPRNNDAISDGEIDDAFQKHVLTVGAADVTDFMTCDLDGDGDLDLVVGRGLAATSANRLGGQVDVYYGNATGVTAWGVGLWPAMPGDATFTRTNSGADCIDHLFGWRVWCTDFNGDGLDDIIASAPGDDGAVDNAGTGDIDTTGTAIDGSTGVASTLTTNGLTVGDVIVLTSGAQAGQCDTVTAVASETLATLATGFSVNQDDTSFTIHRPSGRAYMIPGLSFEYDNNVITDDAAALGVAGAVSFGPPTGDRGGDLFGASIWCCDVNSDLRGDVAIGAPGFNAGALTDSGAVFLAQGTASGSGALLADSAYSGDDFSDFGRSYQGDANRLGFGRQVICCDYNGNGTDDIIVSAAVDSTTNGTMIVADDLRGRIYMLMDYPNSFDSTDNDLDNNFPQVSGRSTKANLGAQMSCGDFNGDGFDDVIASSLDSSGLTDEDNLEIRLYNGEASPSVGDGTTSVVTADLILHDGSNPAGNVDWIVGVTAVGQTDPGNTATNHGYSEQTAILYYGVGYAVITDINGDGANDIFISEAGNQISGLFGVVNTATTP